VDLHWAAAVYLCEVAFWEIQASLMPTPGVKKKQLWKNIDAVFFMLTFQLSSPR